MNKIINPMNKHYVVSHELHVSKDEDSWFTCKLDNGKFIDISFYALVWFASKDDENLKKYADKFDEWETVVEELTELGYDFETKLNQYVQQFNEEDLNDFSYFEGEFDI